MIQPSLTNGGTNEFLVFTLGGESYGVDLLKVQEIRGYEKVTGIANSPAFFKGVIDLRGVIVPIIDLRIKFGLGEPTYDQFTVVIILNLASRIAGVVVDGVSDVVSFASEQIKPAPQLGSGLQTDYIAGVGTLENQMVILTNIERLIGHIDLYADRAADSMVIN